MKRFLAVCICLVFVGPAAAEELRVLAWNVESGGNRAETIAAQLRELDQQHGPFDLVGLTEVQVFNAETYRDALGDKYDHRVSNSGRGDRMVIIFNKDRLNLIQTTELTSHESIPLNDGSRFRSPFVAEFQERHGTRRFQFMVNHLARGDAAFRNTQAEGLREWGRDQTLPTINVGDFNFDAEFDSPDDEELEGNAAFMTFQTGGVWKWIRPTPLVDTNHGGNGPTDRFPNSILDFIFVANAPDNWTTIQSQVIVRDGDFPDDGETSDHRPIMAVFEATVDPLDVPDILRRIRAMKRELEELERILEDR